MGACMSKKKPPFSTGRSCWRRLWPSPASSRAAQGRSPSPSQGFLNEDFACDSDERKAPESGGILDYGDFAYDSDECEALEIQLLTAVLALMEKETDEERRVQDRFRAAARRQVPRSSSPSPTSFLEKDELIDALDEAWAASDGEFLLCRRAEDMSVRQLKLSLRSLHVDTASFLEKDELIDALNEARDNAGNPPQQTPEAIISCGDGPVEADEFEAGMDENGYQFGKKVYRSGNLAAVYGGQFRDGKRSGTGTLTWFNDGGEYRGEWKDDRPHGRGTMTYPNGDVYRGDFEDGKRCGRGTYKWTKIGDSYTGGWRDDKKHGFGTRRYSKGDLYHGQWVGGKRHGIGTMKYAAGGTFTGGWREGRKHGWGARRYADGRERAGEWRDGRRVGGEAGVKSAA